MMMQTGMVKGNTAYSSYLDGMPVAGFLLHPFRISYMRVHLSQPLSLREFVSLKHMIDSLQINNIEFLSLKEIFF